MKSHHKFATVLLSVIILACTEYDLERIQFTRVITIGAIEVGPSSAFLIGDIENIRESIIVESGFLYSAISSNFAELNLGQDGVLQVISPGMDTINQDRAFAARATDLTGSTEYAFRAYVKIQNEEQVAYGNIDRFTTGDLSVLINSIRRSSANCPTTAMAEIQIVGSLTREANTVQLVYSTNENNQLPTTEKGVVISGGQIGATGKADIAWNISCDQQYFVRAVLRGPTGSTSYSKVNAFSTYAGGSWISIDDFPEPILTGEICPKAFASDHHGFVSGILPDGLSNVLWLFDPESMEWIKMQDPMIGVSGVDIRINCGKTIVDDPRIITWNDSYVEYLPNSDTWRKLGSDFDGSDFPAPYNSPFSFEYNNHFIYGTGQHVELANTVYRVPIDIVTNLEEITSFPGGPRFRTTFFKIGKTGYVGLGDMGAKDFVDDFWGLDLEDEVWHEIATFPEKINSRVGLSMNGKGYVLTGVNQDGAPTAGFWEYDTVLDSWTRLTDYGRGDGTADVGFVINDVLYGGFGVDEKGNSRQEFWRYVPELE